MRAMIAEATIGLAEVAGNANRYRFLTDGEMARAFGFARANQISNRVLDGSNAQHALQIGQQRFRALVAKVDRVCVVARIRQIAQIQHL